MSIIVICFPGRASNLRQSEIDTEGKGLVGQIGFQVIDDLNELVSVMASGLVKIGLLLAIAVENIPDLLYTRYRLHSIPLLLTDRQKFLPCLPA